MTQTLFNPSYFGLDLLGFAPIPFLGMGAWWTVFVLTLHTVWSTSVAIAFTEELFPEQRTTPWLGTFGLGVVTVVFALGAVANFFFTYLQEQFVASPVQLAGTAVVIALLFGSAFVIDRRPLPRSDRIAPSPRLTGAMALSASSLFVAGMYLPFWITVGIWLGLIRCGRRRGPALVTEVRVERNTPGGAGRRCPANLCLAFLPPDTDVAGVPVPPT